HQAARRYDLRLRSFDPRPEALRIANLVGGEVGAILRIAAERMNRPGLTEQPVHGDAHLGNVLAGGLWLDLDEACTDRPSGASPAAGTASLSSAHSGGRPRSARAV